MKGRSILFACCLYLLGISNSFAQSIGPGTITVVSESNESFTFFIEGVKQNAEPATRVEVKNIKDTYISYGITFLNGSIPPVYASFDRTAADMTLTIRTNGKKRMCIAAPTTAEAVPAAQAQSTTASTSDPATTGKATTTSTNVAVTTTPNSAGVTTSNGTRSVSADVNRATNTTTVGGTNKNGTNTTIQAQNGYVSDVKTGGKEFRTDNNGTAVRTEKFSMSSNVGVKVKVPGLPGDLPTAGEVDQAMHPMGTQQTTITTTTTTTTADGGPASASSSGLLPGSYTVFCETGDPFILYVDNVRINAFPKTTVVAKEITTGMINMRVEFEDTAIPPLKKGGMRMGRDCSFTIAINKKGERVIKLSSCYGAVK